MDHARPSAHRLARAVTVGSRSLAGARIGLDLDGVCCDYIAYLRGFLLAAGRTPVSLPEPHDYRLSDWFDTSDARAAAHTAAVAAGMHRDAPPLPGAQDGIRALRAAGARVVGVSARGSHGEHPEQLRQDIRIWARTNDITFDDVHLGRPKSGAGCDAYVDDSPDEVRTLRSAGHLAVVFDQPWNRDVPGPRVHGWSQLPRQLADLLGTRRPVPP
jgi:5'-nucleotidase